MVGTIKSSEASSPQSVVVLVGACAVRPDQQPGRAIKQDAMFDIGVVLSEGRGVAEYYEIIGGSKS